MLLFKLSPSPPSGENYRMTGLCPYSPCSPNILYTLYSSLILTGCKNIRRLLCSILSFHLTMLASRLSEYWTARAFVMLNKICLRSNFKLCFFTKIFLRFPSALGLIYLKNIPMSSIVMAQIWHNKCA